MLLTLQSNAPGMWICFTGRRGALPDDVGGIVAKKIEPCSTLLGDPAFFWWSPVR